jgi:hypothetical protein
VELGHEQALERFCIHHSNARTATAASQFTQFSKAVPPSSILHIVGGQDPHAAIHSVMRGLLLGAHNLVKTPEEGLTELTAFRKALDPLLANEIEIASALPKHWLTESDAVIVHGDDDLIRHYRGLTRSDQIFLGRGRKLSLVVIFEDSLYESPMLVARDVSLHDQLATFSPHVVYVAEIGHLDPRSYAKRLATAMDEFNRRIPRRPLDPNASAHIANLRTSYRFKASENPKETALWESEGSTDWTVIFETDPLFSTSCLNRLIFVKPLPSSLAVALSAVRTRVGAVGIYPAEIQHAQTLARHEFPRICPVGKMHTPPATWHHDGGLNLAPLVRWMDFEQPGR